MGATTNSVTKLNDGCDSEVSFVLTFFLSQNGVLHVTSAAIQKAERRGAGQLLSQAQGNLVL